MRVGVALGIRGRPQWTVSALTEQWRTASDRRLDSAWLAQGIGADALTLAGVWPATGTELGIAVVPAQTRHPLALAGQVATVGSLGHPFTLGLGLGHRELLGPQYGLGGPRRVDWLREYLDVLEALLSGADVDHRGPAFSVRAQLALPPVPPPPIVLAAFGPRTLTLAGERTSGTVLWRAGPTGVARDAVPVITGAAARAGRPAPRIVVGLPMVVTDDVARAREVVDAAEAFALDLPTYRHSYEREGIERPSDLALIGDEDAVREKVAEVSDAGATDLVAILHEVDDQERTWAFLAALAAEGVDAADR